MAVKKSLRERRSQFEALQEANAPAQIERDITKNEAPIDSTPEAEQVKAAAEEPNEVTAPDEVPEEAEKEKPKADRINLDVTGYKDYLYIMSKHDKIRGGVTAYIRNLIAEDMKKRELEYKAAIFDRFLNQK